MLARRARRNEQPIACLEGDDVAVEADVEPALQHVADVAGLAPVLGPIARLELDQAYLPRPFAVDFLADVRPDLLPLHVLEAHFERTQAHPPKMRVQIH